MANLPHLSLKERSLSIRVLVDRRQEIIQEIIPTGKGMNLVTVGIRWHVLVEYDKTKRDKIASIKYLERKIPKKRRRLYILRDMNLL